MEFELGPAFTGNPADLDLYLHGIHDIFERDLASLPLSWKPGTCYVQHKKMPPVHHWPKAFGTSFPQPTPSKINVILILNDADGFIGLGQ